MYELDFFSRGLGPIGRFVLTLLFSGAILAGDLTYAGFRAGSNPPTYDPGNPEFVPGEILVKFKDGVSIRLQEEQGVIKTTNVIVDELNARFSAKAMVKVFRTAAKPDARGMVTVQGRRVRVPNLTNIYKIEFGRDIDVLSVAQEYERDPNVAYAEPNYLAHICVTPNDPDFSQQWGLAKIQAEQAWDIETGDPSVPIAIIDTGVDWDHPDLAANIWTNLGEDAWSDPNDPTTGNGIDDDGNGYIDDWKGWDFVTVDPSEVTSGEDPGPEDNDPMDFHGHGTSCSGVAGAVGDNGIGIAGVTWNCEIMALRAGYKEYTGNGVLQHIDVANALHYAADNGARVVNMSFGSYGLSNTVRSAIDYAFSLGVVLIAAAGNEETEVKLYPAGFDIVLAVSATDENDQRAVWAVSQPPWPGASSNYGAWVDVAAPGSNIQSTLFDDSYASWNGTSMATPFVSGLAGLILSKIPTLSKEEVRQIIFSTADMLETDEYIGSGRINAYKALQMNNVPVAEITSPSTDDFISETISVTGSAYGLNFHNYLLEYGSGIYPALWTTIINSTNPVIDGTLATWDINSLPADRYTLRLLVQDSNGNTAKKEVIVIIEKDLHAGWPVLLSAGTQTSSPVFGDLDGDGNNEIVIAGEDGYVYILNQDGTIGWSRYVGGRIAYVSPALADLNDDGLMEIVFGTFQASPSRVFVLNYDGTDALGWPKNLGDYSITTPSIRDIDADGQLEIIAATQSDMSGDARSYVYIWKPDGSDLTGWPKEYEIGGNYLDFASTPSIGNIDDDGYLEIVVGFKDGLVHVLNHDGTEVSGWPIDASDHAGFLALTCTALGDVDNDGNLEIVGIVYGQGFIHVWDRNGNEEDGWPKDIEDYSVAPPTLGDLDNDGDLEIIAHSNNDKMYAWHHNGDMVTGWPIELEENIGNPHWPPVVIGDIDGDGFSEIIAASDEKKVHAWHNDGTDVSGWPKFTVSNFSTSSAIGDIDGDGMLELIAIEGRWEKQEFLGNRVYMWDVPGNYDPARIEWPMFHHDPCHTGLYGFGVPGDILPPILLDPVANKSGTGVKLWLDWEESSGATSYEVEVDDDSTFSNHEFSQAGITDTRCLVGGLNYSTEYNWRVQAYKAGGVSSDWSEGQRFTTMDEPPVFIDYPDEYVLIYLEQGDQYYIDRDFVVRSIPTDLQNLLCIKTANHDKYNSRDSLLSFRLDGAATVYVAYDHRPTSQPDWLISEFTQTDYTIEVSDEAANPLIVWSKRFGPGTYALGGNMAPAAQADNVSNYVVIISSEYFSISGHVSYCTAPRPIPQVELLIDNQPADTTDVTGYYQIAVPSEGDYDISARKASDFYGAISGADAVAVLKHLAFVPPTLNECQLQAGDVTQDGTVTGSDAVAILYYIAFMPTGTARTGEWVFDPASVTVSGPPDVTQDFVGNLLGDVTQNWGFISANLVATYTPAETVPASTMLARENAAADRAAFDLSPRLEKTSSWQNKVMITLPDTTHAPGSGFSVPILVTTDSVIALAQCVIEYDSTVLRLDSVTIGEDVNDFSKMENRSLPFAPSCITAKNVLIQICSPDPSTGFSGDTVEVARLFFFGIGSEQESSPLRIDPDPTRTFLTTPNLYDLRGEDILFVNGQVVLPVELESFEGQVDGNCVKLTWSLTSETNNVGFDIERSADGYYFVKIGFVEGQGSTSRPSAYYFADTDLELGRYYYRLRQIDLSGRAWYSASIEVQVVAPKVFRLYQNYPNPFNAQTKLRYEIPEASHVTLSVLNVLGREICRLVDGEQEARYYVVIWDGRDGLGRDLASGIYPVRLQAGDHVVTKKTTILR